MKKSRRAGFTLIELLIFSAIFAMIIGAFITILIAVVTTQSQQSASGEAQQQGQFLLQQFQYYIESARLVDMPADVATSTLVLREATSSNDPTTFTFANGTVYLQQGTMGVLQPLTSNKVTISNLSFTRHYNSNSTSSPFGTDTVSYSFIVSSNAGNQGEYSETFQSSASVFAPVPKIALIQQAKVEDNSGSSIMSLVKTYVSNNESGDLLIAVIANHTIVTPTIADTNGNTWTKIASATYSAYSETLTLYAAQNASSGANTVTASFSGGTMYPSMYLYEYRGASTSTSFDTWGAQIQASTTSPISPIVSPTSTVELLLGVDDNAYPTNAVATAGAGYTLETSSTVNNTTQVFVEDQNQYISNPVAAGWTSSILTSSTAMIATFK